MRETAHVHWLSLRSSTQRRDGVDVATVTAGVDSGFGAIRYALTPEAAPRLLIPVSTGGSVSDVRKLGGPSVDVTFTRLSLSDSWSLYIDIGLRERRLESLFGDLCTQIVSRIADGAPPLAAVASCIRDFRILLAEEPQAPVDVSTVLGLLGELVILREGVKLSPQAVDAWSGPLGQRHDFRGLGGALEVKSTAFLQSSTAHIHGLEQLSPPADTPLWLAHVVLERSAAGNVYVEQLCKELIALGVQEDAIVSRLASMGCQDFRAPEWNALRTALESIRLYSVSNNFPRLTTNLLPNGQLPVGVVDVQYTIDLGSAADQLVPSTQHEHVYEAVFS
ncbi:TPA: PD-(D/E)XK motif protein [Stenotrophomonas maltophilia]